MPDYDVVIKQVEPQLVAGVRDILPSYQVVGRLFDHVLARRGAIASPALRKPAPLLSADDKAEIERLIERQARRLKELG